MQPQDVAPANSAGTSSATSSTTTGNGGNSEPNLSQSSELSTEQMQALIAQMEAEQKSGGNNSSVGGKGKGRAKGKNSESAGGSKSDKGGGSATGNGTRKSSRLSGKDNEPDPKKPCSDNKENPPQASKAKKTSKKAKIGATVHIPAEVFPDFLVTSSRPSLATGSGRLSHPRRVAARMLQSKWRGRMSSLALPLR